MARGTGRAWTLPEPPADGGAAAYEPEWEEPEADDRPRREQWTGDRCAGDLVSPFAAAPPAAERPAYQDHPGYQDERRPEQPDDREAGSYGERPDHAAGAAYPESPGPPTTEGLDWETVAYESLLPGTPALDQGYEATQTVRGSGPLRCPRFTGDADLLAVLEGRLRLAAPGTSPYPAPVRSQGAAVRKVQEALVAAGYPLPRGGADGKFGAETGRAVGRFKREHRIEPADPVVGPATLRALDAACAGRDTGCLGGIRVAVVGAGFAGLMAAWSLESGGTNVTVFEASGRIGGRVRTDRALAPGKVVEAGAELVGENHPTCIALAREFGLSLVKVSKDKDYETRGLRYRVRLGNTDLSDAELRVIDRELHRAWTIIAREAAPVDALRPWRSPDAAALDAMTLSQRLDRSDMFGPASSNARRYFELVAENDQCAPVDQQSYLGYLAAVKAHALPGDPLAYWTRTETHRCKGGNDQLGAHLAKGLRDLRLNTPVTWVEIGSRSVRVGFGTAGLHEDFDYIVLATAPQVWPKIHAPTPFRPDDYTMATGPAVKFLSAVKRPFWEDRKLAPSALWDQLGSVWEGTDKQPGGAAHCLSVYSGGGLVLDPQRYQDRLEDFYPGYRSALMSTSFVDWPNEPWVKAGYSVPAPGQVTTIAKNLSSPFAGRLYFAGEQASPGYFGYMEGALTSGVLAAYRIAAAAQLACRGASTGASGDLAGRASRLSAAIPHPALAP